MPILFLVALLSFLASLSVASTEAPSSNWRPFSTESADGERIAFYVAGSLNNGVMPLLVISGGPGSNHRYMRVGGAFQQISKTRPVIMFDQRGTGDSSQNMENLDFELWADDIEAIRNSVGIQQLDLLGHSFGGIVAMSYAKKYPDALRSITLTGSSAPKLSDTKQLLADIYPDRITSWRETRQALSPRFKAGDISIFFSMEFVDPEKAVLYERAVSDYTYRIDLNNALREQLSTLDYTETVRTLDMPVLIVHGRFDAVVAPSVAWSLHKLIDGSQIKFLKQAGHLAFVETPEVFADTVETFLGQIDSASNN